MAWLSTNLIWVLLTCVGIYWWWKYKDREYLWLAGLPITALLVNILDYLSDSLDLSPLSKIILSGTFLAADGVILILCITVVVREFTKSKSYHSKIEGILTVKGILIVTLLVALAIAIRTVFLIN